MREVRASNAIPNFLDVLDQRAWTDQAACRDLDYDDDVMFPDLATSPNRPRLESASLLLALLICERCPVRLPCLSGCLEPILYTTREETEERPEQIFEQWVDGAWGGTLQLDRWALRHLPVAEAVNQLEASFARRLATRIKAYSLWRKKDPRKRREFMAVDVVLAERRTVTRFDLGNPGGPGRTPRADRSCLPPSWA